MKGVLNKTLLCGVLGTILLKVCLSQRHPIRDALYLGNQSLADEGMANCIWRRGADRDVCPDPDVKFTLYTPDDPTVKHPVDLFSDNWLRSSNWDPILETVIIIHGYAGGDDTLPIVVLRDAYLLSKRYNVLMVDWGALCKPPCYVAAVHNMKPVSRCVAEIFSRMRSGGLRVESTTCVGHSLGAHICGIMANYLPFRIHRIIGLDPARPLIRNSALQRLDAGDAHQVQVLHTNAGRYGEGGRQGHLDVCINGGRSQPFCANTPNEALCSHIWSICYQAESLFSPRLAEPCARKCPTNGRPSAALPGSPLRIGQGAPHMAAGTYCLNTSEAPFCPLTNGGIGDERCCLTESGSPGSIKNKTRFRDFSDSPIRRIRQLRLRNQSGRF